MDMGLLYVIITILPVNLAVEPTTLAAVDLGSVGDDDSIVQVQVQFLVNFYCHKSH